MVQRQSWKPDTEDNLVILQEFSDTGEVTIRGVVDNGVLKITSPEAITDITPYELQMYGKNVQVDVAAIEKADIAIALNVKKNAEVMPALIAAASLSEVTIEQDEEGNEIKKLKKEPVIKAVNGKLEVDLSEYSLKRQGELNTVIADKLELNADILEVK